MSINSLWEEKTSVFLLCESTCLWTYLKSKLVDLSIQDNIMVDDMLLENISELNVINENSMNTMNEGFSKSKVALIHT